MLDIDKGKTAKLKRKCETQEKAQGEKERRDQERAGISDATYRNISQ